MKVKSVKKNAILNTIKQLCQILFPIITIPYVTRTLGANYYGRVSFSTSIINYFVLIASLGISSYAIREGALVRDDYGKFNKFANEIFSINVISMVVSYVFLIAVLFIPKFYAYKELILIQSTMIFFTTIGVDWINSVYEDYIYITARYIVFQIFSLIFLFIFVHGNQDYIKYACILVFSSVGANLLNVIYVRRYVSLKFTFSCNFKKHIIPILILFGNQLAITLYVNSDITMLGLLSDEKTVGIYTLSSKIYTVIKQVLNAVIIVSIPRLSYYLGNRKEDKFEELAEKIKFLLLVFMVPISVGLFSFSKDIMCIVGGKGYVNGYTSLMILSVAVVFSLLSSFFTNCILLTRREEKKILLMTASAAIVNIVLNIWMIPAMGANGAAVTTLISEMLVAFWSWMASRKYMNSNFKLSNYFPIVIGGVAVGVVCAIFKFFIYKNIFVSILLSVIFSSIIYLLVLTFLKCPIVCEEMRKMKTGGFKR